MEREWNGQYSYKMFQAYIKNRQEAIAAQQK
jgi:hypothetical protein